MVKHLILVRYCHIISFCYRNVGGILRFVLWFRWLLLDELSWVIIPKSLIEAHLCEYRQDFLSRSLPTQRTWVYFINLWYCLSKSGHDLEVLGHVDLFVVCESRVKDLTFFVLLILLLALLHVLKQGPSWAYRSSSVKILDRIGQLVSS